MVSKRFTLRQALLVVAASLASACAIATRPPTPPQHTPGSDRGDDVEGVLDRDIARNEDDVDSAIDRDDEPQDGEAAIEDDPPPTPCPSDMVFVTSGTMRFCIDKYEASLVEIDDDGTEKPFPHWLPVDGRVVRAISRPGVFPQGFISELQAEEACSGSKKRLCSHAEWKTACMGPAKTTFPYGDTRNPGTCHDRGKSAVAAVFGWKALADPVAAPPRKTSQRKGGKRAAPQASSSTKTRGSTKTRAQRGGNAKPTGETRRQAHVTIKGRASATSKARAARVVKSSANAETASKKAVQPTKATAKHSKKRTADARERSSSTARHRRVSQGAPPVSVERSVWTQLNDPRLGQVEGALAQTGSYDACVNDYGVFDMVGNLHEWVRSDASATNGTFAGGYYLDTTLNGDGCHYRTTAHSRDYHDYSTGFRCCADAATSPSSDGAASNDVPQGQTTSEPSSE